MFVPSLAEFRARAGEGALCPVYREILLDTDTPVSAFAKLGGAEGSFLLESVVGGETWAAYSFVGVGALAFVSARGQDVSIRWLSPDGGAERLEQRRAADPTRVLEELLLAHRAVPVAGLPRFSGGAVGWLTYDVARSFEQLPSTLPDRLELPEASFVLSDTLVIFDNLRQTVKVVATARTDGDLDQSWRQACARVDAIVEKLAQPTPALRALSLTEVARPGDFTTETPREDFLRQVLRAKEYILAGDAFQVVLSQRLSAPATAAPFDVYRALRVVNPSPYMFHLVLPEATVTGASPEVLVRVEGGRIQVRPLAGTRPRGVDAADDARLEAELRADPKEVAEHVMLIDLGRNDVGRVSIIGSVSVDEQLAVERYSHVMHLVSHVSGQLLPGATAFDALRAAFPAGTLSGAPKIRAMEIIEELEPSRRGLYGGAVGYFGWGGNLDFSIAIRTLLTKDGRVHVQAGAGIVADSDPAAEWDETMNKARAVLRAVAMAS